MTFSTHKTLTALFFKKNEASFEKISEIDNHAHAAGISTVTTVKIPPLCHATVCLSAESKVGYLPPPGTFGISHISCTEFPTVVSNSGLVQVNNEGNFFLQIFNNDVVSVEIPRNSILGQLEIVDKGRLHNVDRNLYLASIERAVERKQVSSPHPHHKNVILS